MALPGGSTLAVKWSVGFEQVRMPPAIVICGVMVSAGTKMDAWAVQPLRRLAIAV